MPGSDTHTSTRYRIAYGSVPKDGGTVTFYRNLRTTGGGLLQHSHPGAGFHALTAETAIVAFQIDGIVDYILDAGHTGLIAPAGDCEVFARCIAQLAPASRQRLAPGRAAAQEARERFTPAVAAGHYSALFEEVMAEPAPPITPSPWSRFALHPVYDPGWKAMIPAPLRSLARRLRSRLLG